MDSGLVDFECDERGGFIFFAAKKPRRTKNRRTRRTGRRKFRRPRSNVRWVFRSNACFGTLALYVKRRLTRPRRVLARRLARTSPPTPRRPSPRERPHDALVPPQNRHGVEHRPPHLAVRFLLRERQGPEHAVELPDVRDPALGEPVRDVLHRDARARDARESPQARAPDFPARHLALGTRRRRTRTPPGRSARRTARTRPGYSGCTPWGRCRRGTRRGSAPPRAAAGARRTTATSSARGCRRQRLDAAREGDLVGGEEGAAEDEEARDLVPGGCAAKIQAATSARRPREMRSRRPETVLSVGLSNFSGSTSLSLSSARE